MLHEESVYGPDVLEFRPERFLDNDLPFPDIAFGFGRRQCPGTSVLSFFSIWTANMHFWDETGRHLARESVWLTVASVLATLDISKAKDEQGDIIEPEDSQESGIVS